MKTQGDAGITVPSLPSMFLYEKMTRCDPSGSARSRSGDEGSTSAGLTYQEGRGKRENRGEHQMGMARDSAGSCLNHLKSLCLLTNLGLGSI